MSNLSHHLETISQSSKPGFGSIQEEISVLEKWIDAQSGSSLEASTSVIPDLSQRYQSPTLDHLRTLNSTEEVIIQDKRDGIAASLLEHPQFLKHKDKLWKLLTSERSDSGISEEIAELVGFDMLEFATDLVQHRQTLVQQYPSGVPSTKPRKVKNSPEHDYSEEAAKRRLAEKFRAAAERPLWTGTANPEAEILPHIYTSSSMTHNHSVSTFGSKYLLPLGTIRQQHDDYEEVTVPPARTVPPRPTERLIPCSELPPLAQGSFPGYKSLNRIQSIVYHTAFKTNENMLICAPTGAGKTDVAMLTILRAIDQHRSGVATDIAGSINRDEFKVIYVAPMKALAAEIVRKLGKRLAWLRIKVRELTGDMQLTKAEIAETQIIVTTPEKWDVVTRKPTGEGELATKVKLLIIDEVHLLNDERGAVIETIVARTVRQVESTQSLIRIVGLSATLPNYIDVGDFLRVSRREGLFYFDSSFRPVPLEQHFVGVKGKAGSPAAKRALDKTAYHFVSELAREGHQVMVFVHSRKDTVKSAESLKEFATLEADLDIFDCRHDPQFEFHRREIGKSKNKEMKQLFDYGFGIHHAGMLRSDRNMMERLFEAKVIKVLCCTATLAWGVNLPAHGVIIKGTQLYDPSQGKFVDLSVLDVLQIFGRAGRPGMETSGVGFICTSDDKLPHYLEAVTAQHPIESKFAHGILDSLNAEIALGTVTNVAEGAEWLSYTYLFVRMRKNPMVYGMTHDDPVNDPDLTERRHSMITIAGRKLAAAGMVQFNEDKGSFDITDIGRIASKYYVRHASIEVFQKEFRPKMTEADVLALLSMSTEFEQVQVRENEVEELKALEADMPCQVKGGTDTSAGKVNILLQAHISKRTVDDFALVSDMLYSAENGGRIIRSLLEIALSRKWANASNVLMAMSKSVEKRMWGYEHPLIQFDLSTDVIYCLGRWADEFEISELASMTAADLGKLIHLNERHGAALRKAARQFPCLSISSQLRPLSHELLQIRLLVEPTFDWSNKIHGSAEPFWIWVEDDSGTNILQLTKILIQQNTTSLTIDFVIPMTSSQAPFVIARAISDRWIGAETEVTVEFDNLKMPAAPLRRTPIVDLPLLRTDLHILDNKTRGVFAKFRQFNSIQMQCFWPAFNTDVNMLISSSASSGKTQLAMLAICRSIRFQKRVLVVVPRLDDARNIFHRLRQDIKVGVNLVNHPDKFDDHTSLLSVVTATDLLNSLIRERRSSLLTTLGLVVFEDLELLDPTYEIAASLLLQAIQTLPIRVVGVAAAINNGEALADWLGIRKDFSYCFPPVERDQALSITFQTFTIPYSAALMRAMAKPVYDTIRANSRGENSIVFVPSIGQCSAVLSDLIKQCTLSMNLRGFLGEDVSEELLESYVSQVKSSDIRDGIMRGLVVWHGRMNHADRLLSLRLFAEGIVRVLITPRESCWTVPVRAGLVIVMGTQYTVQKISGNSDAEQKIERYVAEYSVHELVRMEGRAVRHGKIGRLHILCQAEHRDTYMRFLTDGLPLESQILGDTTGELGSDVLQTWVKQNRSKGLIKTRQDVMDLLSSTFLAYRLEHNPTYYDAPEHSPVYLSRVVDALWERSETGERST
ncbi:hypothetical protein FS842_007071 [Serendipita sp. 407]|nr:hypothetical protein FS842_007071 [Serendipita sp. 407]